MNNLANPKVSLLYVEDDQTTQEVVSDAIRRSFPTLDVLVGKTGEEGLELFERHRPQIVITDIMVPGMNGMEMAKHVRAESSTVLIIAATAYNNSEFLLDAIKVGVTHFLLKPLDLNSLLQAVRESISRVELEWEMKVEKELFWKLSHVVQQSPSSVIVANARGTIEYVNSRFASDSGFAAEDILGQSLRLIFSEARPFDNYEIIWSTLRRGLHWRGQVLRRRKNGEFLFQDVCIFPLSGDGGLITHYVAVLDDVANRAESKRVCPVNTSANGAGA
ncbi:response regulator [Geomonas sp. RF6]|uniref:response regulator n=1 Tax=Geomonas sp. RF6 TaxID=2897342 RepID=UPI001E46A3EC|nr:response regulator [Geomonas sp. RF6]UFS72837.1 response regulator [Geomonas sp. RF6]